jgi:hypothetical protein
VDPVGCGTLLRGLIGLFVFDMFQIPGGLNHIYSGPLQPLAPPCLSTLFEIFTELF